MMKKREPFRGHPGGYKKGYGCHMREEHTNQEDLQMEREQWERQVLGQLASLLVKENLISREEQIRFLSLVRKGE